MLVLRFCIPGLLMAASMAQLGCAPTSVQTGELALCANWGASGFAEPHLVINPADQTMSVFDVNYHLENCSNDKFVCLDGPIPFVQPLATTSSGNSSVKLASSSEVRIVALATGGSQIEITKIEPSLTRKITYNYAADTSLRSLDIIDMRKGESETTHYERCQQ